MWEQSEAKAEVTTKNDRMTAPMRAMINMDHTRWGLGGASCIDFDSSVIAFHQLFKNYVPCDYTNLALKFS